LGRKFESIEAQNAWLAHWEERWAATRIHGRKKRQVMAMFLEEKAHLLPLPLEAFRPFKYAVRTVDNAGLVQVESSYYSALPAALYSEVAVRICTHDIEILDRNGQVLRRHAKAERKGQFILPEEDRIFNPSREGAKLLFAVTIISTRLSAVSDAVTVPVCRWAAAISPDDASAAETLPASVCAKRQLTLAARNVDRKTA
jgi:hypothetical protein